jgi:hypothetical protein
LLSGRGGAGGLGGGAGVAGSGGGVAGFSGAGGAVNDCQRYDSTQSPLDIAVLLDQSGSMDQSAATGTRWTVVVQALGTFLNAPENANVAVALGYFPLVIPGVPAACATNADCGNYGPCVGGIPFGGTILFGSCQQADVCTVSSYTTPEVPFSLPPNHVPVLASLANHAPGGGTPTQAALQGFMQYAMGWKAQHPERKVVVVLATDGEPSGCTTNTVADVANVAAAAVGGPGIPTYVVGVGSSLTSLNAIAQAGGTAQAFLLDTSASLGTAFQEALKQISGQSRTCRLGIPTGVTDLDKVNVIYEPPGNAMPVVIPKTSACDSIGGWQLDPTGTNVLLCPTTCAGIAPGGAVQVGSGCLTSPWP